MPVSSLSQLTFINLGPLTSTYAAPSACLAETTRIGLAPTQAPAVPTWFESCELPTYGDCLPYGEERDRDWASRDSNHGVDEAVYYHSPGLDCPASWTTAGVAVKSADGASSVTGIFDPTITGTLPVINPTPNILLEALQEGETAVLCCPSGFTANTAIGCHKTVAREDYTADTVCRTSAFAFSFVDVTFTYGDQVQTTGLLVSDVGTRNPSTTTTAAPRGDLVWVAGTYVPGVTLIRGGGGSEAQPTETASSSSSSEPVFITSPPTETSRASTQGPAPTTSRRNADDDTDAPETSDPTTIISITRPPTVSHSSGGAAPTAPPSDGDAPSNDDSENGGSEGDSEGSPTGPDSPAGSPDAPPNSAPGLSRAMVGTWAVALLSGLMVLAL
ncbi:hypothetical protein B0I35DRAFT_485156 [Stachybotrys elegans]|uniref:Uncharacterized protein n=1 Tax=Stachybotrys elegans TaxID=80388 RepID=A0A8K0SH45_9HYPO|nr:hypothetical protein B0I35DRAFT_485156 [Stachybotrys elegans]